VVTACNKTANAIVETTTRLCVEQNPCIWDDMTLLTMMLINKAVTLVAPPKFALVERHSIFDDILHLHRNALVQPFHELNLDFITRQNLCSTA
jgi:hypothetical protein